MVREHDEDRPGCMVDSARARRLVALKNRCTRPETRAPSYPLRLLYNPATLYKIA